jgi:NAD(P)-dependent dehydrogenase (short-subunit alcohol dehydrogenase family)
MEIDAVGTFTMSRAAFPALQSARDSVIINISATLHYGATWYQVHASAAKAAVDSITRSLALEWGEYGIRVNGVAPGPIKGTAGAHVHTTQQGQWGGEVRAAKPVQHNLTSAETCREPAWAREQSHTNGGF